MSEGEQQSVLWNVSPPADCFPPCCQREMLISLSLLEGQEFHDLPNVPKLTFSTLIIAGRAALITLIASTTASAIALTQEVKTPTLVNNLAKTVTYLLYNQEDLDRHLEQQINVLYDTIHIIGEEI